MKPWAAICIVLAALVAILSYGCESEPEPEEQARAIYKNANKLRREGRTLEAMEEYDKLMAFKATQTFNEANQALMKEGITIGAATASQTNIELFALKNQLLRDKKTNFPDGTVMRIPKQDLWGSFYQVDYSSQGKYIFRIMSLGPDKTPGTDDDLYLLYGEKPAILNKPEKEKDEASQPMTKFVQDEFDSVKKTTPQQSEPLSGKKIDPATDQSSPAPPGQRTEPELKIKRGPDGQPTVDLNDLLKK